MKNKRDWRRYLMEEWVIPLGLGAAILFGAYSFLEMLMRISER